MYDVQAFFIRPFIRVKCARNEALLHPGNITLHKGAFIQRVASPFATRCIGLYNVLCLPLQRVVFFLYDWKP